MEMRMNEIAMRKAADWWFDKLVDVVHDNGDRSFEGAFVGLLADTVAEKYPCPEEKRDEFAEAFTSAMRASKFPKLGISCDYYPCLSLREAMDACDINHSRAPWKTNMWFRDNGVYVSAGYGAPHERLCDNEGVEPTTRFSVNYQWFNKHGDNPDEPIDETYRWFYEPEVIDAWLMRELEYDDRFTVTGVREERLVDGSWVGQG